MCSVEDEDDLQTVLHGFIEFCGLCSNYNFYFVAHNNDGFDKLFLRTYLFNNSEFQDLWEENNVKSRIKHIDTMRFAQKLVPESDRFSLKVLCQRYSIEQNNSHRALGDSKSLYQLYDKLARLLVVREDSTVHMPIFGEGNMISVEHDSDILEELEYVHPEEIYKYIYHN